MAAARPRHRGAFDGDAQRESSAQFIDGQAFRRILGGSPMVGGPSHVSVSRERSSDWIALRAGHDGYADRYGILHERTVTLAADGARLDGEDLFLAADGGPQIRGKQDRYAVRFHLHPSVKASRLTDGHGVLLMMPNKEAWTFSAGDNRWSSKTASILPEPRARAARCKWSFTARRGAGAARVWTLRQANPAANAVDLAPRPRRGAEAAACDRSPRLPRCPKSATSASVRLLCRCSPERMKSIKPTP